jgi:hypothetical protein
MSLEEAAHGELLRMRKHSDGVTVGALARTEALRQVLGGGDPRVAYNALKHILLIHADDLAVTAAGYSLGYASDGPTHLDRLTDFGRDHGYDQRQARRYSDRGVTAMARYIGTEWTLEASPVLRVTVARADRTGIELILQTERMDFIEMRTPRVELVAADGQRTGLQPNWIADTATPHHRETASLRVDTNVVSGNLRPALTVLWTGELWPRIVVTANSERTVQWTTSTLGARLQISTSGQHRAAGE